MRVGKPHHAARARPPGLTLLEVLIAVIVIAIIVLIMLPAIATRPYRNTGDLKDRTTIRGVLQGMVIWAQHHDDGYPLPSQLDPDNTTTAAEGFRKDTTANIMSALVFQGFVPPELLVSPTEVNGNIEEDRDYEWDAPSGAVDPALARWDPAFAGDFRVGALKKGNVSYAHLLPHGERLANWANTFDSLTAQLANRGPEITSVTVSGPGVPQPEYANPGSNAFAFHGSRGAWSGLVGFADGHVDLVDSLAPETITYPIGGGPDAERRRDVLFYDEPDDASGVNAFLGVFVDPGADADRQLAIWD